MLPGLHPQAGPLYSERELKMKSTNIVRYRTLLSCCPLMVPGRRCYHGAKLLLRVDSARPRMPAEQLEDFLREVEKLAQSLGFAPTMVLNVPFDTPERRDFARRLSGSYTVEDQRLKDAVTLAEGQLWNHDPDSGTGRLIPKKGVVLVLTDEQGCETCFGFFKYPERILDVHGKILRRPISGTHGDSVISWTPRTPAIARSWGCSPRRATWLMHPTNMCKRSHHIERPSEWWAFLYLFGPWETVM